MEKFQVLVKMLVLNGGTKFTMYVFIEGGFYEGEDGLDHLSEQGQANLQRMENLLGQGDGQLNNNRK